MRLLLRVTRPIAGQPPLIRDVLATAPDEATVGDLARSLAHELPEPSLAGTPAPGELRLVVPEAHGEQATPPELWDGPTRLDPQGLITDSPIRHGMLLSLGAPSPQEEEPTGVVEVRIVGGRGAGTVRRWSLGDYTIGGEGTDLPLDGFEGGARLRARVEVGGAVRLTPLDGAEDLPAQDRIPGRSHPLPGPVVLESRGEETPKRRRRRRWRRKKEQDTEIELSGIEEIDPEAGRRLLELDRRAITADSPWEPGAVLTAGDSLLTVGRVPEVDAVSFPTPGAPTIDFNRPPRLQRASRNTEFMMPRRPTKQVKPPFPFVMLISPVFMALGSYVMFHRLASLMFVALSPLMMIANYIQGRTTRKRTFRDAMSRYESTKAKTEKAALDALTTERGERRADFPDPAELLLRATGPRSGLWERRPADPDWLELRVGTADLPSNVEIKSQERASHEAPLMWTAPDVPVTVPLGVLGVVGVTGPERLRLATWMVSQCATLHSPADLELVLLSDSVQGGAGEQAWDWSRWLPHMRGIGGQGERAQAGLVANDVQQRVNELVSRIEAAEKKQQSHERMVPRTVVILDGSRQLRLVPGMVQVLREGAKHGICFLCLDPDPVGLPEECRSVVVARPTTATLARAGEMEVEQVLLDLVPASWPERVARSQAAVRDVSSEGAAALIPVSSRLLEVVRMEEPDAGAVLERWAHRGRSTTAVLGEDAEGPFSVDISRDGPHALVAGTTGSGKSELLQTLIASLCLGNRPDALTFVLVDYKGGAAFKDCARLPHTVGMVTDLDGHLTSRALESLGAELRHREHQLARLGAKDIEDYVATMTPEDEPMPRLMIIIDEFAALVAELPDFVTGLVDIARRGRSLGVHLVLATQRPAGVVSAEIKSNTNLRIALRVTDENDSQDVIEARDAAHVPSTLPGRAFARLGLTSLRQFQASRVGGRPRGEVGGAEALASQLTLRSLAAPAPMRVETEEDVSTPTDLARLVDAMRQAHAQSKASDPRSPWLPALGETITLDDLASAPGAPGRRSSDGDATPPVPLGMEDMPAEQAQRVMTWDYAHGGHLGIAGAPRTGRSCFLRLIAAAIARSSSPAAVHMYGIDGGSGALLPLVSMPHVGAVVTRDQPDRVRRLFALLVKEVARRQQVFALRGCATLAEQRATAPPGEALPYLLLLIDRWDGFTASFEDVDGGVLLQNVESLMREGLAVGLRVVVTGDRTCFRGRMGMMLEDRLLLRMPAPEDFDAIGMRPKDVPVAMPAGRGFRSGETPREVQVALLDGDPAGTAQVAATHREGSSAKEVWANVPELLLPGRVDDLPMAISAQDAWALGPSINEGMIALGVGGDNLHIQTVSLPDIGNGVMVLGPRRSGRSTALCFTVDTAMRAGAPVILVTPRRSPLQGLAPRAAAVLDGGAKADELREALKPYGAKALVVVDDFELLGADHAIAPALEEHLKACRDEVGGVLIACGSDEVQGMYRGPASIVKKTRTGLILAPRSAQDGEPLMARLPRSVGGPAPIGRGVLATTRGWSWVQVPYTSAESVR
ncbi:DNA translocase FtsK [Actinomyces denticolens]|uniref:FtsK/SpoIIIE domain-containing protein n=1 Tax=Actinomyces TaxID=1654 RepID=UPI000981A8C1|nr:MULTISPECIES: FtsK/SpoIIIE domain-containing protein [Actinomyces]SUU13739.1 DNA translocase FtsK [Actinomyces denticolens]